MNKIDIYDTTCPYTNGMPCVGCGSRMTKCTRCIAENEEEQCDDDCEHCEWVTCPKMEVEK